MRKPGALYYECLNFTEENKAYLRECFDVGGDGAEVAFVYLGEYWDGLWMDGYPNLRVIVSNTTSVQHIDVVAAGERGIKVVYLDDRDFLEGITAVAELTIGLIVALTRNIIPAFRDVKCGNWNRWNFGGERMLQKMKLAVIGVGRIGLHVSGLASDMVKSVVFYNQSVGGPPDDDVLGGVLKDSDIVTVHIPLEGNEGFCGMDFFAGMKDGSYFINTSRGEIVDDEALLWALETGKLRGAAVDVLSGEFAPGFDASKHPLVKYAMGHDNLIITPHIGGSTKDAWHMTQRRAIDEAINVFRSDSCPAG